MDDKDVDLSHQKLTENKPSGTAKLKKSFISRTYAAAKLSSRLGIGTARKLLNLKPSDPDKAIKLAVELAGEFDAMKGLMMKFGQMAGYMGAHLPAEARAALATLQASSTAMPFPVVRDIIETDLGGSIEQLFEAFDEHAFAAASIGQVHRAVIAGKPVAVKVQYPDIQKLISMDLSLVGNLFTFMTLGTALPGKAMANELKARILEECDYRLEALNQKKIAALCAGSPQENVPQVIDSHCGLRVLTSEYVDALSFQAFCDTADQDIKNRAAMTIFTHTFDAIFRHCYFNGDPHPGNYLFAADGSVTFLDFGCVKKFDVAFINRWKPMAKTVIEQDKVGNIAATVDLGLMSDDKKFDHEFHWHVINHVYKPFLSAEPFTYTPEYNRQTNDLMIWQNKNRFSMRMPADFLFVNRLQWGLNAVLADMKATNIWKDVFHDALYSEAMPLFGE